MQDCRVYKKGKLIKNGNDVKIQMGPLDSLRLASFLHSFKYRMETFIQW